MESPKLIQLHDHELHLPVYVNPSYITFIMKSPVKNGGTIVGVVADDLGCEVDERVEEIAALVAGEKPPEKTEVPTVDLRHEDRPKVRRSYRKWKKEVRREDSEA